MLDDRGHILTNAHVVGRGGQAQVVFADGRRAPVDVIGTDPGTDIAILAVRSGQTPAPLPLGTSGGLRVGDAVLAVGSPLGLSGTVTPGFAIPVDRAVRAAEDIIGRA